LDDGTEAFAGEVGVAGFPDEDGAEEDVRGVGFGEGEGAGAGGAFGGGGGVEAKGGFGGGVEVGGEPVEGGEEIGVGVDVEEGAMANAAFLGDGEAEEVAGGGAAGDPGEVVGDAVAEFVWGAAEGFGGGDFGAGAEVEDFLAGEVGVEGVGAVDGDLALAFVPVAGGVGMELEAWGRGEEFEGVVGVVELGRGGGEDEFEVFVGGDDWEEGDDEVFEVVDEGDFVEEDVAGPGAGGGEVRGDDFGAGVGGFVVVNAEFEFLGLEEFGEGVRVEALEDFVFGGVGGVEEETGRGGA
jgi:hypothetical protein